VKAVTCDCLEKFRRDPLVGCTQQNTLVSGLYLIDGQGCANMLILGKIRIAGLTISAAETPIESAYRSSEIYTNPTITITILSHHPINTDLGRSR
jgi:protein involved in polysaccharide export with SLBB domain